MTLIFEPFGPLYEMSRPTPARRFAPPADLIRDDDAITVVMDVPGLRAGDIEIELDGNRLTVRGERTPPGDVGRPQRIERGFGPFERTLRLPDEFDADAVDGSIGHGVLTVRIPLSRAHAAAQVDIGEPQREPEAASVAS
jgi:HSP20 family protein